MNSSISKIIFAITLVLFGHFFVLKPISKWIDKKSEPVVSSTIILKEVKKVMKLVSIEGNFSELMNYNDFETFDLPGFRKKAIIKVDGKVLYGYDLEHLKFEIDEKNKILTLEKLPQPEIIAIETDISYYDISEGIFNNFTETELTHLNEKAKQLLVDKAEKSGMKMETNKQALELLYLINGFASSKGWEFKYPNQTLGKDKN